MNEKIDSFVIRREYVKDEYYQYGDLVEYEGKTFIALSDGKLSIPSDTDSSWYELNSRMTFHRNSVQPKFTEEGDKWFDTSTGTLYTRMKQTNGFLIWVEL